jgi:hypothetical protein
MLNAGWIAIPGTLVMILMMGGTAEIGAQTIWNGPITNFTHSAGGLADQWTTGVAITRGSSGGLYNEVTESNAVAGISPEDTEWAEGALSDFASLSYGPCPLEMGNRPPNYIGVTFVVHLINENIYLSLNLTAWGGAGGGGQNSFSYARTTPAAVSPPITLAGAGISNGQFTFSFSANSGQSYVVENSSNLVNWVDLATNVASGNPVVFSNTVSSTGSQFYRVELFTGP